MSYSDLTYTQPIKNAAREQLLGRAVTALTAERNSSTIIQISEFDKALDYALQFLQRYELIDDGCVKEAHSYASELRSFYRSVIGPKEPSDLRVLYLCGPEPSNDLRVFYSLGIIPQNIWAIESDRECYQKAVAQLHNNNSPIHIHYGDLDTFFDWYNERFDIVYIDACGPLPGGKPNTVKSPLAMFHRERLASLGALVTNFAQPPEGKREEYENLLSCYFAPRYKDLPREIAQAGADPSIAHSSPSHLLPYLGEHFDAAYSDFVTRFLVDLGQEMIPHARIFNNPDLRRKYFAPDKELRRIATNFSEMPLMEADDSAEEVDEDQKLSLFFEKFFDINFGDLIRNPASYPVLSFLYRSKISKIHLCDEFLSYTIRNQNERHKNSEVNLEKAVLNASLLAQIIEGHKAAASPELLAVLAQSWFDKKKRIFCDPPLPHLLVNSLFGIYGHPYHPNPRKSIRFSYTAKKTKMYSDLILFDQCRYYYDFLPTIDILPSYLKSIGYQIILRTCLDRMGRHDFASTSHPFRGSALGGGDEFSAAGCYDFEDRRDISELAVT